MEQSQKQSPTTFVDAITNNQDSSTKKQIVETYPYKDTPFLLIKTEAGCWVAMGAWRLCEPKATLEECAKLIDEKDWEIITSLIGSAYEAYYLREKKISQETKQLASPSL